MDAGRVGEGWQIGRYETRVALEAFVAVGEGARERSCLGEEGVRLRRNILHRPISRSTSSTNACTLRISTMPPLDVWKRVG
jgi:hypothetical protein